MGHFRYVSRSISWPSARPGFRNVLAFARNSNLFRVAFSRDRGGYVVVVTAFHRCVVLVLWRAR